jgi:hypothetical protein
MRERDVLMDQLKLGHNLPIAPKTDNFYPKNFDVNRFESGGQLQHQPVPAVALNYNRGK